MCSEVPFDRSSIRRVSITFPGKTLQASFSEEGLHTTFLNPVFISLSIDRFLNCVLTNIPEQLSKSYTLYNYIVPSNVLSVKSAGAIAAEEKNGDESMDEFIVIT